VGNIVSVIQQFIINKMLHISPGGAEVATQPT
jgi:hypothetical protein